MELFLKIRYLKICEFLKLKYANFATLYLRNQTYTQAKIFTGNFSRHKVSFRPHTNEIPGFPKRGQKRPFFWEALFGKVLE